MLTHEVPLYGVKYGVCLCLCVCVCVFVPWGHVGLLDYFLSKTVNS
jgi:hypothetical protein